jgi:lycopene cyclase domain-containing protein
VSGTSLDSWQYLLLLASCVAVTLPLEVVGGARVYRRPRALLATLAPVVAVFGGWDLIAVHRGQWWYNARYILGPRLAGLPVEEWLFFLVVPVCALLCYEVLGRGAGAVRSRAGKRARR